jgi:hypothetical protein
MVIRFNARNRIQARFCRHCERSEAIFPSAVGYSLIAKHFLRLPRRKKAPRNDRTKAAAFESGMAQMSPTKKGGRKARPYKFIYISQK